MRSHLGVMYRGTYLGAPSVYRREDVMAISICGGVLRRQQHLTLLLAGYSQYNQGRLSVVDAIFKDSDRVLSSLHGRNVLHNLA
jgi:hypothetical protein